MQITITLNSAYLTAEDAALLDALRSGLIVEQAPARTSLGDTITGMLAETSRIHIAKPTQYSTGEVGQAAALRPALALLNSLPRASIGADAPDVGADPAVIFASPPPPFVSAAGAAVGLPPPPPATGGPELDTDGLPWDARIHSSSRERNKDGRWRSKRGLNDGSLVARVEAELRQTMGAPAASVPAPSLPPPPAAAPAAVPAPPVAPSSPGAFAAFMASVTPEIARQRLTPADLQNVAVTLGLPTIMGLAQRADLIPAAQAAVDALLLRPGA